MYMLQISLTKEIFVSRVRAVWRHDLSTQFVTRVTTRFWVTNRVTTGSFVRLQRTNDKTILHGIVKGERGQGRQKKRLEDDIRERTGLEFAKCHRAVENREKWRKLVVNSSVVPQRPTRLRDR